MCTVSVTADAACPPHFCQESSAFSVKYSSHFCEGMKYFNSVFTVWVTRFRFWGSRTEHGLSFYLTNLWLCVCLLVCMSVCVLFFRVTLEFWACLPSPQSSESRVGFFWRGGVQGLVGDKSEHLTCHVSHDQPIGKFICNNSVSTSRWQSLHTFIREHGKVN